MLRDEDVERVLVVTAHPDDVDFGSAGTMATWAAAGVEISYCIVTNGDAGGFDPDVPRTEIPRIRQQEQRDAAAAVGVSDVTFLGYPDGRLYVSHELRRDIARVIRQKRPQRVVTQPPERNYDRIFASHPDHLATGEATLAAVYPDARNPFAHPELAFEGLDAWTVDEVWMSALERIDRTIDITDVFDRKLAALRAHESQTAHMDDLEERLRTWGAGNAARAGLPEGRLAECYRVVDTNP